ncbi:hypothetical protein E2C01_070371 [Portunus trituberculatus]|uniref:Uncharacterized protein n=1 Tax=Portunus trituberculatus TaxID=210409 RepID=A0A5B7HTZ4_PORTR|nr:hypothetical protein [Portunus trituberculatus]
MGSFLGHSGLSKQEKAVCEVGGRETQAHVIKSQYSPLLATVGRLRESAMMTENQSSILFPIASRAFCVHSVGKHFVRLVFGASVTARSCSCPGYKQQRSREPFFFPASLKREKIPLIISI